MALKRGFIILWWGAVVDIPYGWQLCDGTNGAPDLRDRFIVGAGTTYDPNDTGGANTHTHDLISNSHNHLTVAGTDIAPGANFSSPTTNTVVTGTTDAGSSIPPYYALAFIMKMADN